MPCTFVGHAATKDRLIGDAGRFRCAFTVPAAHRIVLLLPGSRKGEVSSLLPLCLDVANRVAREHGNLFFVIPTVPHVAAQVREGLAGFAPAHAVVEGSGEKADAFAAAHAALAASGTVTLELALAGVPSVICYRVNALTAYLVRRVVRVRHVSLPNIILGREVMPEFLQERATAQLIAPALSNLLCESPERRAQVEAFGALPEILTPGGVDPSNRAACVILDLVSAAADPVRADPVRVGHHDHQAPDGGRA